MGYNLLLISFILVYFIGRKILSSLGTRRRKVAILRIYFDAVYFIVFSFFCALSLDRNLKLIFKGEGSEAVIFVHLAACALIIWIFARMVRSTVQAVQRCARSEDETYPIHMIIASVIRIVTAFSVIYFAIWVFDPSSFSGLEQCKSLIEGYFDFIYFSFVTFATVGYGDISPEGLLAKCCVTVQIILFFVVFGEGLTYASDRKGKSSALSKDEDRSE